MKKTMLCGIGLLAMVSIADAQLKGFNQGDDSSIYEPRARQTYREGQVLHPTLPYSNLRDFSRGDGYVVDGGQLRPVIPYTNLPDYSRPSGLTTDD